MYSWDRTTDTQLARIVHRLSIPMFRGVVSKDRLPHIRPHLGWWIVNMQSSDEGNQQGTHWVYVSIHHHTAYYFDSYGQDCPDTIHYFFRGKTLVQNKEIVQSMTSQMCGWFTIFVAYQQWKKGLSFKNIVSMFNENHPNENDHFLKTFFTPVLT